MNTAERIKELRILNSMSQADLAEELKISQSAIAKIEIGKNEPTANTLTKLANYFKVTTDYLLGREEEDGRIIVQETELPSDENALLTSYRTLPPELKAMAQDYFKSLDELKTKLNNKR